MTVFHQYRGSVWIHINPEEGRRLRLAFERMSMIPTVAVCEAAASIHAEPPLVIVLARRHYGVAGALEGRSILTGNGDHGDLTTPLLYLNLFVPSFGEILRTLHQSLDLTRPCMWFTGPRTTSTVNVQRRLEFTLTIS